MRACSFSRPSAERSPLLMTGFSSSAQPDPKNAHAPASAELELAIVGSEAEAQLSPELPSMTAPAAEPEAAIGIGTAA